MANLESVHQMVNNSMKYCCNNLTLPKGFDHLEVDNIIDSKVSKDQKRHYLVCFKTWLAEDQLNNEVIDQFWRRREEDAKKWTGSHDGESDKENNFLSPTSSRSKRPNIFPTTEQQTITTTTTTTSVTTPDLQYTTDENTSSTDKSKFTAVRGVPVSQGGDVRVEHTPLPTEGSCDGYEEGTYELRIDESESHCPPPSQLDDSKPSTAVERIQNVQVPSSCPELSSGANVFYEQSTSERNGSSLFLAMEGEHSMEYVATSNMDTPLHRRTFFHFSQNQQLCDEGQVRDKEVEEAEEDEETPIVTMQGVEDEDICEDELEKFPPPPPHIRRVVEGEPDEEVYEDVAYEDGRLSMYDDEPVEGRDDFVEYEETEEAEDSDVSDFGVEERQRRNLHEDRNSSDYSDVTPGGMELNKFTPLNSVQMEDDDEFVAEERDEACLGYAADPQSPHPITADCSDDQSVEEKELEVTDMSIRQTAAEYVNEDDGTTPMEEFKATGIPEKLSKKRKGKTLDDIVRKISSANEQAAETKGSQGNNEVMSTPNVEDGSGSSLAWDKRNDELMKQDAVKGEDLSETSTMHSADDEKKYASIPNGGREHNVYWSAGKAFQKRNISYKCKFCEHRFDDESLLKDHERSHGQHQCRNCNEVFLTSQALFEHRETAHAFKPRQRYNKCRFCPTLYADPAMLQRHEEIHHLSRPSVPHPPHPERGIGDLPPPLMTIDESQRKFPQYEKPRSPQDMNMERKEEGEGVVEDEEGKSIVRNPIRNLLGKMYQTQKKPEPGNADRFPPRFLGYRPRPPHTPVHQFHYTEYPQHRHPAPSHSNQSPDHLKARECYPDARENVGIDEENRERVHICRLCNKTFAVKEALEQHWLTQHVDTVTFTCEVCQELFIDRDDLSNHMNVHLKKDFYCGYCKKSFDCRSNYESHMRAHSNDRPFRCHICGRAFSLRTNLRRHVLIHTDITPYRCHICFKGFRRSDMLSSHVKQYHGDLKEDKASTNEGNQTNLYNEQRSMNSNASDSVSPVFQPPPSGGTSPYTTSQELNMNGHTDNGSYIDVSPSQASDEQNRLMDSRINKSPDHSASTAIVCRSEGGNEEGGIPHTPTHPPHPRPPTHLPNVVALHQMPHNQNEVQVFHHPPHSGMLAPPLERPPHSRLLAPIPLMKQARFAPYKTNLVNILPHPVQASRGGSMECGECGEKFTSESLYEIHMQSHVKEASYTCRKCRRTFSGKSQYNSHMQTHENNKSHSCPYCHRSFSMKGNLRRHIRIHTNEAPYECPICFQRFRRSDGLKGHIKRHDAMGESAPVDMVPSQASAKTEASSF